MQNARKWRAFFESDVFGAKIHLDETARFGKNSAVSFTIATKKKKQKAETVPF